MSVTIHDVARRAGVSPSTVSRVLNDTTPVREEKRQLVLEAVESLGYAPNPAALSLLNKRTGGIGVLLPFVNGEFFSELLSGMDEAAQDLGAFLIISTSHRRPNEFSRAMAVMDKRVDGLVVMAPELDAEGAASIVNPDTPVVFVNTQTGNIQADTVNFDNAEGARMLTQHLIEAGHRRIGLIRGPEQAWDAAERARGYRDAMAAHGLATDGLEFEGGYTRDAGHAAAQAILRAEPRPTAVVAANDYCAFGVLSALHEADVAVPDDMSVCGFDGLSNAQFAVPSLTTVRVPIRDIGARATRLLGERLNGEEKRVAFSRDLVPVELVPGRSTGPPPA